MEAGQKKMNIQVVFLAAMALHGAPHAQDGWTVIRLDPPGSPGSRCEGAYGRVQVGDTFVGGRSHASLWRSSSSSWIDLNPLGADMSWAVDANESFQVGWTGFNGSNIYHAAIWAGTSSSWFDLHPVLSSDSACLGIRGDQVVGYATPGRPRTEACLWILSTGAWVDLHPLGSQNSMATDTDGVQQAGWASGPTGGPHAMLWSGSKASGIDLNPLGAGRSEALAIHQGQQAGYANITAANQDHACIWAGSSTSFVDLSAGKESRAYGAHSGVQVGYTVDSNVRATIWSGSASSRVDLHALLPGHYTSSGANDVYVDQLATVVVGSGNSSVSGADALLWIQWKRKTRW